MKSDLNIIFDEKVKEYVIILKERKRKFPWWILLFLLPLLLLVKCEKDLTFHFQNPSKSSVSGVDVNFYYTKNVFFQKTFQTFNQTTDTSGTVIFKNLEYSLYSYLFYRNQLCSLSYYIDCYASDTLQYKFLKLRQKNINNIELSYLKNDVSFIVQNKFDGQPIVGAEVKIIVKRDGIIFNDIDTSIISGEVFFKNIPTCSEIELFASCYGYNDTSYVYNSNDLFTNKNIVYMTPITKSVTFWVKNLIDKNPLPNATAELFLEGINTGIKILTNTNGAFSLVGNGIFESIHIIKMLQIKATKTGFYDSLAPIPSQKVEFFIKASAEERTIYLRPKEKCLEFKIVDAYTSSIITGAECIITTKAGNTFTEYSNVKGIVQVCGLYFDDIVSVTATKSGYTKNDYTVVNQKIDILETKTTEIPLKPEGEDVLPCSGGTDKTKPDAKKVENTYYMGKKSGSFVFQYFTNTAADSIYIYANDKPLWSYEGITGNDTLKVTIKFESPLIKIIVKGKSDWWYKVNCP